MRSRTPLVALAVLGVLFFAGCSGFGKGRPLSECGNENEPRDATDRPSFVVSFNDRLQRLDFDSNQQAYVETIFSQSQRTAEYARDLRVMDGKILSLHPDLIAFVSPDMTPAAASQPGDYGAFDVEADHAYVTEPGSLLSLGTDAEFKDLARFTLGSSKTGHDVLVCGDDAYVLDNVVVPLYVYRVDVVDPARLRVLAEREVTSGVSHLSHQWLDVATGTWYIVVSSGGMNRASQAIEAFDPRTLERRSSIQNFEGEGSIDAFNSTGFSIRALVPSAEPWCVVYQDGALQLARLVVRSDRAVLQDIVELDIPRASPSAIVDLHVAGDVALVTSGNSARLVALQGPAEVLVSMEMANEIHASIFLP